MLLTQTQPYKSINLTKQLEFPDFTIITGINGSGKSQLLEAINQRIIKIHDNNQIIETFRLVNYQTLVPNNSSTVSPETLRSISQSAYGQYQSWQNQKISNPNLRTEQLFGTNASRYMSIFEKIANTSEKDIMMLDNNDFFTYFPIEGEVIFNNQDIFYQNFSNLFKRYHTNWDDNKYRKYLKNSESVDIKYLSDEDFILRFGEPPWEFVNKIIKEAKLGYHINSPVNQSRDASFEFKLINEFNDAEINFNDLSSGEKVLMSLALSLYNSTFDIEFPKVLLMDEPDAPLHPSMTKQLLDVVQNVFIKDKGVKVILATHSPSTVALAPDESLYVMNKTEPRIEEISKDKALRLLTYGVPSLSFSYENRRQIFVENQNDTFYYERFYEKLKDKLVPEISLNFIGSGVNGQGNCDQVKNVVNQLVSYGNRSIYGIIDWDLKNNGNDFVKVLGKNKRYSIENYIFDPIILAAFLLRETYISNIDLGLASSEGYVNFRDFDNPKLQAIADIIVQKVSKKIHSTPYSNLPVQICKYLDEREIKLPNWFLHIQGHNLESYFKDVFPQLNRSQKEGELKKEILKKVINDFPELIPMDILDLFKEIQNYA